MGDLFKVKNWIISSKIARDSIHVFRIVFRQFIVLITTSFDILLKTFMLKEYFQIYLYRIPSKGY